MANTNITMRIDENLKDQLQKLVSNLGLDMTTFFTMAAKQAVREQAIPFKVTMNTDVPNEETISAFMEVENMKKNPSECQTYDSFSELLEEVSEDV